MPISELENQWISRQAKCNSDFGAASAVERRCKDLEAEIEQLGDSIILSGKALALLQEISTSAQTKFLSDIEFLVSDGLSAVFESPIKFQINSSVKGSQIYLDFTLKNEDGTETDVADARGGGLVALCGIILRIVMLRLLGDQVRQVLVLDEPLAHLSEYYVAGAGELLQKLSDKLDIQIIMITHQPEFIEFADTVYELKKTADGVTISNN